MSTPNVRPVQLTKQQMKNLLQSQRDLEMIKEEIEKAIAAGIVQCGELGEVCNQYAEAIAKIKAQYMKGQ